MALQIFIYVRRFIINYVELTYNKMITCNRQALSQVMIFILVQCITTNAALYKTPQIFVSLYYCRGTVYCIVMYGTQIIYYEAKCFEVYYVILAKILDQSYEQSYRNRQILVTIVQFRNIVMYMVPS
uniref:Uncharacterized protein n=1 Tax=Rhizophagus irregularis (strain DAOM 181602 / DAOM 197198 / MUCL 43194) TaxID=747089 RepID=U9TF96_RHIID